MIGEALKGRSEASETPSASNTADSGANKPKTTRRSEIAKQAAMARWHGIENGDGVPREEFPGMLPLGDHLLPCAVLSNRQRVLSERGVTKALGGKRGGSHWNRVKHFADDEYRPVFLSANNLAPIIPPSLSLALSKPIVYKSKSGHTGYGVPAELLPEICEVFLQARRKKLLTPQQEHIAQTAEILMTALAKVGIIALVDEATGYQEVRERDELHKLLELYIAKELLPWAMRFPREFYQELFRLRGWQWNPMSVKRPKRVALDTIDIVYDRLPVVVLDELRARNPVIKDGRRRYKLFQFLTSDIGDPHLERQIAIATAFMRASSTWQGFKRLLDRAVPSCKSPTIPMDFGDDDSIR